MALGSDFSVIVSRTAAKELAKIPLNYRARVLEALASLAHSPYAGKALKGELEGKYSLRVWPYRIIYQIVQKQLVVEVLDVGHRQGVYK